MKIGMIGSGNVGQVLTQLFVQAGNEVVIAHRGSVDALEDLARVLGAEAGTDEQAEAQEIVVLAVPFLAIKALPAPLAQDPIIIDATNYFPDRDAWIAEIERHKKTTSQVVAEHFQSSKVVKAFNTIGMTVLARLAQPEQPVDRIAVPYAGDDEQAKKVVASLIWTIGFEPFDLGGLATSFPAQADGPLFLVNETAPVLRQHLNPE
ncbi:dinucleotide-binding enzyme [Lacticaseibacillus paracasei subsp. paracasei Lpp71]|uniref:Dinucleotide-binding enzyme n=1 Tax=Lacticaseibacillus paracasei subsp. paracasei Lpp71 TaxID=1256207 RepID=A0A8E0IQ45_LACPA|nr:dinucleotide-binding enzyme [Lacticaseibacillus paracasei subsp. paracasei Lpp71]